MLDTNQTPGITSRFYLLKRLTVNNSVRYDFELVLRHLLGHHGSEDIPQFLNISVFSGNELLGSHEFQNLIFV